MENPVKSKRDSKNRIFPTYELENKYIAHGKFLIAGVDEAGRGPLAGPVVAAAVIFKNSEPYGFVNDSKKMTSIARWNAYQKLFKNPQDVLIGIGVVSAKRIDQKNILEASLLAMKQAIFNLPILPEQVLVDGNARIRDFYIPQETVVQGDQKCLSIAAASVIAKVTRDQLMLKLDMRFPQYGFFQHKGYPTKDHLRALQFYGPSAVHRMSFGPVKELNLNSEVGSRDSTKDLGVMDLKKC